MSAQPVQATNPISVATPPPVLAGDAIQASVTPAEFSAAVGTEVSKPSVPLDASRVVPIDGGRSELSPPIVSSEAPSLPAASSVNMPTYPRENGPGDEYEFKDGFFNSSNQAAMQQAHKETEETPVEKYSLQDALDLERAIEAATRAVDQELGEVVSSACSTEVMIDQSERITAAVTEKFAGLYSKLHERFSRLYAAQKQGTFSIILSRCTNKLTNFNTFVHGENAVRDQLKTIFGMARVIRTLSQAEHNGGMTGEAAFALRAIFNDVHAVKERVIVNNFALAADTLGGYFAAPGKLENDYYTNVTTDAILKDVKTLLRREETGVLGNEADLFSAHRRIAAEILEVNTQLEKVNLKLIGLRQALEDAEQEKQPLLASKESLMAQRATLEASMKKIQDAYQEADGIF